MNPRNYQDYLPEGTLQYNVHTIVPDIFYNYVLIFVLFLLFFFLYIFMTGLINIFKKNFTEKMASLFLSFIFHNHGAPSTETTTTSVHHLGAVPRTDCIGMQ